MARENPSERMLLAAHDATFIEFMQPCNSILSRRLNTQQVDCGRALRKLWTGNLS
jgi:hypothetical protein